MSNALVRLENGHAVTTSLLVAQHFKKQHKNVIRDIEELLKQAPELRLNFELTVEIKHLGNVERKHPVYQITRDGFTLLAMGYTGEEALKFKISYINAFNQLEAAAIASTSARLELLETLKDHAVSQNPLWQKVLRYKSMGLSNVETSKLLEVSPSTIDRYVRTMRKLELMPDQQLVTWNSQGQLMLGV